MLVSRIDRRSGTPIVRMLSPPRRTICRLLGKSYPAGFNPVNNPFRPNCNTVKCRARFERRKVKDQPSGSKRELYHDEYQKVFGDRCGCRHGECRVTDWRKTQLDSPVGYDVIAYREWVPLRQDVWMPDLTQVSSELRREWAHICAYPPHTDHHMGDIRVTVPCAIINIKDI